MIVKNLSGLSRSECENYIASFFDKPNIDHLLSVQHQSLPYVSLICFFNKECSDYTIGDQNLDFKEGDSVISIILNKIQTKYFINIQHSQAKSNISGQTILESARKNELISERFIETTAKITFENDSFDLNRVKYCLDLVMPKN